MHSRLKVEGSVISHQW